MDPFTLTTGLSQLSDLTFKVCRALYECYQQVKDAPLKARKLHDEMQTLLEFVNQLRRSLCDRLGRISHVRHIK